MAKCSENISKQLTYFRDQGYHFLGLRTDCQKVTYFLAGQGSVASLEQAVEDNTVLSIAQLFPLADFAERQMYRDSRIKALGNSNLNLESLEE